MELAIQTSKDLHQDAGGNSNAIGIGITVVVIALAILVVITRSRSRTSVAAAAAISAVLAAATTNMRGARDGSDRPQRRLRLGARGRRTALRVDTVARCCYRSLVYPGMAPLDHYFRYHSFPSLRLAGWPQSCGNSFGHHCYSSLTIV